MPDPSSGSDVDIAAGFDPVLDSALDGAPAPSPDSALDHDLGPDPDAVGRALTALAHPDDASDERSYAGTIADARDAFSDLTAAASFLDDGGEVTLRRAVGAARRDDRACAREGRTLLRELDRLRAAIEASHRSNP